MSTSETRSTLFRRSVEEAYEADALGPADRQLVDEICSSLDLLDLIREEVADMPLVEVRQGGPRVNPLVTEERLRTSELAKMLSVFPALAEEG